MILQSKQKSLPKKKGEMLANGGFKTPEELIWFKQFKYRGKKDAAGEIYKKNYPLIKATIGRYFNGDYEELLSESDVTFINVINRFDETKGYKFSTYLCNALIKNSRKYLKNTYKSASKEGEFKIDSEPPYEKNPLEELINKDEIKKLLQAMSNLNDKEIELLKCRFIKEQSFKEISEKGIIRRRDNPDKKVTKQRIQQLYAEVIDKLRFYLVEPSNS